MNEHVRSPATRPTTQAAEGLPRWHWTTAELIRLTDLGAFTAEDRIELIGGEIVPMSPVGRRHELIADELHRHWGRRLPPGVWMTTERQLNLVDDSYTKPDLWVFPDAIKAPDVRGDTVLIVVEVAQTSLKFDLGTKADLYAKHGVREYWVIDAATLDTRVHRDPSSAGYSDVVDRKPHEMLTPTLVPQLAVRLADLDLGNEM